MDVAGFIDLLTRSGLDMTPLEVAEALWLAGYATAPAMQVGSEPPSHVPLEHGAEPSPGADDQERETARASQDRLPLYLPSDPGMTRAGLTSAGMSVPIPASTALPGSLALMRALRPLKLRAPDLRHRTLDEPATVDATARSRVLMPVLRAASERRFSLALVVDTGPAMAVWSKLESELSATLARLAAFRDLQRWYLCTDHRGMIGVSHSTRSGTAPRDPAELLDPAGRRVILVLTDGAGSAWYSGAMARTLQLWGCHGPVAILQPLPQQLWTRTALSPVRGRLTAARQAASNAELEFSPHGRAARWHWLLAAAASAAAPPPVPVPVLEIAPDWLRGWARLVGAGQGATLDCAVTLAPAHPAPDPSVPAPEPVDATAEERVRHFIEQASPEAQHLASYLSTTPLSLPVMRHVQQAMLPGSGPSHLAEILLGGLVTTAGVPGAADAPPRWRYEFAPGVRNLLLSGLGRTDARRVLTTVSRELNARFGRGADEFGGVVPVAGAQMAVSAASRPFAEITTHVLERITGTFTTASEQEPQEPEHAVELPASLIRRYQRTGRIADIDTAIAALRRVAAPSGRTTPNATWAAGPPVDITAALELATALRMRYLALITEPEDLDEAIDILRQAIQDAGSVPTALEQLATALGLRHARTGSRTDIDEAVHAASSAVANVRESSQEFPRYAATLGELLLRRGHPADLDHAVARFRLALAHQALPDNGRPKLLTELSTALRQRAANRRLASRTGATARSQGSENADLDEAIDLMRLAITLSPDDQEELYGTSARELAARYAGLGAALLERGRIGGARADQGQVDLRDASESFACAVRLAPDDDAQIGAYLTGLGVAAREGALFAEAVRSLREAIKETPLGDPQRPRRQTELAITLVGRYESEEHRGDLIEARLLLTEATATLTSAAGARHPATLSARLALARAHAAAGQDDEARTILAEVLPELPPEHPDYWTARELREMLHR